ncbi:MAG: twin-arginine translocation pathway signal protein [Planctomycetes bacterium]|nr:twin-arginine translocation pathway signal protein [Planctomycetota bacterium]
MSISRRRFIADSTTAAAAVTLLASAGATSRAAADSTHAFVSPWAASLDRVWLGREFWANPLQDWRVANGAAECINARPNANVHLLTRIVTDRPGSLTASVRIARPDANQPVGQGKGSAGFRIGVKGDQDDYRDNLLTHQGIDAGFSADGRLFIGPMHEARPGLIKLDVPAVDLTLAAAPEGNDKYALTLTARNAADGSELGKVTAKLPAARLPGNLTLVNNFGAMGNQRKEAPNVAGLGRFTFADWKVDGDKLDAHDERHFGPILFSQYTLSNKILKLSVQLPPLGKDDNLSAELQVNEGGAWKTIAKADIDTAAYLAVFRVEKWDDTKDHDYRVRYDLKEKSGSAEHTWAGVIRRDPVDKPVITVADISCNAHYLFPNAPYVRRTAMLDPDLVLFVGDQFYEPSGGYGVVRKPVDMAMLDELRKWYLHGWTWRELTRDRPSVAMPDDHDVYQGNIWGDDGRACTGTQESGGYEMDAAWVNVVHRSQTAHLPDPYDPQPIKQGISVYYCPMTWGRISFAIIADRMFKTGPDGFVPKTGSRADHVVDPNWDPKTADLPGAHMLGDRQIKFLEQWVSQWRGADIKCVISQTAFTGMATTHGGNRERLVADYDSNGWPQTPRNEALRVIRKAFACHLCGDQHLNAVVQYGVDEHRDGPITFIGPAVNNLYPRWFEPTKPGENRKPDAPENTGDFRDCFGHPMTVLAVDNPKVQWRRDSMTHMQEDWRAALGIARFDKANRKISYESWLMGVDPKPDNQIPGWPVVFEVMDNYAKKPVAYLPSLTITGCDSPAVDVRDEKGELVYSIRLPKPSFQPHVFAEGSYTVRVYDPESDRAVEKNLDAKAKNDERMTVAL